MDEILAAIDKYAKILNDVYFDPQIFYIFVSILIFLFVIRGFMLLKFEYHRNHNKVKKKDTIYIVGHVAMELVVAFVVGYLLIKLTFANPESYIINYLVAPFLGMLAGIWVDYNVIIKMDGGRDGGRMQGAKKSSSSSSSNNSGSNNNVTVNITNGAAAGTPEPSKATPVQGTNNPESAHIKIDEIDNENFDKVVIDSINELKDTQVEQSKILNDTVMTLNGIADIVVTLKETEMNDKKIELKQMIYDCLNAGFATPAQNDKITMAYQSYVALDGNGEIKTLYEQHYLRLGVHEDRRIKNMGPKNAERRQSNNNCEYGKYDNTMRKNME